MLAAWPEPFYIWVFYWALFLVKIGQKSLFRELCYCLRKIELKDMASYDRDQNKTKILVRMVVKNLYY